MSRRKRSYGGWRVSTGRVSANSAICDGVVVRHADVADLAFVHQLLERTRGLRERDLRVGPVHLVEVDVVDAERLEARVDVRCAKPGGAGVADEPVVGHPQAALGRDHHLVAAMVEVIAKRPPEHSLGGAEAVALRGVEEVHPSSRAWRIAAIASSSSNSPHSPPSCQVPKAIGETSRSVIPSRTRFSVDAAKNTFSVS